MFKSLDFQNDRKRSIFWVICFISWISFIATNVLGIIKLEIRRYTDNFNLISNNIIWGFLAQFNKEGVILDRYYPIKWDNYYLLIIFSIILFLSLVSFILFLIKTSIKRDDNIFNAFMDTFPRFHFIPLFCGSFLFLSGIFKDNLYRGWNDIKPLEYVEGHLAKYSIDLFFSFLGVLSLAIIKKTMNLEKPFYLVLIIKDGFYSILLALFTYSFFYGSAYIGFLNKLKKCALSGINKKCNSIDSGAEAILKTCGIIFAVLIGLINLLIGGYLKDYIIAAMNGVIYLGLMLYFTSISEKRKDRFKPPFSEGVLDIIVFICSLVEIAYLLLIKNKKPIPTSSISTPLILDE